MTKALQRSKAFFNILLKPFKQNKKARIHIQA